MLTEHMKRQSDRGFVKNANLPAGEVATVAISADAETAIKMLNSLNQYFNVEFLLDALLKEIIF